MLCFLLGACVPAGLDGSAGDRGQLGQQSGPSDSPGSPIAAGDSDGTSAPRVLSAVYRVDGGSPAHDELAEVDDQEPADVDADGGVDELEPYDAGALPPGAWSKLGYLGCTCEDGAGYEGCADYRSGDPEPSCDARCEGHGPALGQSIGPPPNHYCRAPRVPGHDRLTCRCEDGYEERLCADLWCADEEQRAHLCEPLCADHGGIAGSECEDAVGAECGALYTNLVVCICEGERQVAFCGADDCTGDAALHPVCAEPCAAEGGGRVVECVLQAEDCN